MVQQTVKPETQQETFGYALTQNDLTVLAHLRAHLRQTKRDTFSADDFRRWKLDLELCELNHFSASELWHATGSWFAKAKVNRQITVCGWVTSVEPSNHSRKIRLYRLVKK